MKRHGLLIAAALALLIVATPEDAKADPYVGLDLAAAVPIPESFAVEPTTGPSASLRLGYRLPIPVFYLSGEVLGSWQNFPHEESPQRVLSGRGGARVGFDAGVALKAYGHIGYTNLAGEGTDYTIEVSGLSWDAGLALDITLVPFIDFGIHGGYVTILSDNGDVNWVEAGLHAELSF